MASEEDQLHLTNIINSINEIDSYGKHLDYNQFVQEEEARTSIIMNLQMIGDAASNLTDEFKDKYGYVDYDVLVNLKFAAYNNATEIDPHSVWAIIKEDLPRIRDDVASASEALNREEDLSGL